NRKTVPPSSALTLRTVRGTTIRARAATWIRRLEAATGDAVAADLLYAGDHWRVVRSLREVARRKHLALRTYVCSAGYGLLSVDALVHSYAATFAAGHDDSVTRGIGTGEASAARRAWWRELGGWAGPRRETPR